MNAEFMYDQYIALKAHFNTKSYDYFKYNARVKNAKSFETRKDRVLFERLAREIRSVDMPGIMVSQFIENQDFWVGDYSHQVYLDWRRRTDSLDYLFKADISRIFRDVHDKESFRALFVHPNKQHPPILQMMLNKEITFETFTILEMLFPFFHVLNKNIDVPLVWNKKRFLAEKYSRFIQFDKEAYAAILKSKLEELV